LDNNPLRPTSQVLKFFLSDRPDLLQEKQTIVFGLGAPYALNASDISRVTAYYGLYSKQPQFIELAARLLAARLLLKEIVAPGASPVSVTGINYDLIEATSPDPDQTFSFILYETGNKPGEDSLPSNSDLQVGDSITLETGVIVDRNKHPVPNGTQVRLLLTTTTTEGNTNQREVIANTQDGRIQVNNILEASGILAVEATSGEPPARSPIIQVDVINNDQLNGTQTAGDNNGFSGIFQPNNDEFVRPEKTTLGDWLLIIMVTGFLSLFAYQTGAIAGEVRWGVRWGLMTIIGGLVVNAYLSFDLPGSIEIIMNYKIWGIVAITLLGGSIGWWFGWIWRKVSKT
ncbi:MAG: hypothetical protein N2D54_03495, partial [Chloroflexota bacterium]